MQIPNINDFIFIWQELSTEVEIIHKIHRLSEFFLFSNLISKAVSVTKKHLILDLDFDLELDFVLVGLSSSLRDYRLCHFIFKQTGLAFVRGKEDYLDHKGYVKVKDQDEMDFHIVFEKSRQKTIKKHYYSIYRYCDPNFEYEYYLINNRSVEGGFLVPELPNFDYFLIIKHYIDKDDLGILMTQIRSIKEVILTKELDPTTLKSKENLIF
ncbi:IPExxxVDY family protein [Sphingobacterium shayense]|uniref:IPExxxVDY family protein n=1 Tax=Sphingobacterium shayense TaxID=626343 RepID=UPI001553805A|nr:IPExxxVDY family protein [Sphingobacterium shayense]NQD70966.1 IPExxxVDY family protein [Sphingobacterium shayense]